MNKVWLIVGGVALVVAGLVFWRGRSQAPTRPVEGNAVAYTDEGFSPSALTVFSATTVTFTNQSGRQMWVASAVHPTHQELPGFDQLVGVGQGQSYQFTFNQPGSFRYHNHLFPGDTGTVVAK